MKVLSIFSGSSVCFQVLSPGLLTALLTPCMARSPLLGRFGSPIPKVLRAPGAELSHHCTISSASDTVLQICVVIRLTAISMYHKISDLLSPKKAFVLHLVTSPGVSFQSRRFDEQLKVLFIYCLQHSNGSNKEGQLQVVEPCQNPRLLDCHLEVTLDSANYSHCNCYKF